MRSRTRYQKAIVAAGHSEVCRAAATMLEAGGNAFDGMVAAGFASTVVEPSLTSLGGGGFMLGYDSSNCRELFFDFFVDTPGKGRAVVELEPHFFPVTVNFTGASQVFNVGLGSVAVPGTLKGLLHIHARLGTMPLKEVIEPARLLALGHRLNSQQAHFISLLKPIMTLEETGRTLYLPGGEYLQEGDLLQNLQLAEYLEQIAVEGDGSFYQGDIASAIADEMSTGDGLLTLRDLNEYTVKERQPLKIPYCGHDLLTAPEPSVGGVLIGLSLSLAARQHQPPPWGSADYLIALTDRMREVERLREEGVVTPDALERYLNRCESESMETPGRLFSRGTTHISVADNRGNCASMTCSNGEGSGYFAPGTGIMLNNMMGEDDLHPDGFHTTPAGSRVQSMMAPSMLAKDGDIQLVLGSGGSKRIRTAITQVLGNIVVYGQELGEAVEAPRLYLDEDLLQVEPGLDNLALQRLNEYLPIKVWSQKDMYFGGVHCVIPGKSGVGDSRRGGSVAEVELP